jgi:hypothetical protein
MKSCQIGMYKVNNVIQIGLQESPQIDVYSLDLSIGR